MEKWVEHWKNIPDVWSRLCFNKNSIELLIKYPDYINWFSLVQNESDDAIDLIIKGQINVLTYTRLIKNLYLLSQNNNPKAYELYKKLINRERDRVLTNVFNKKYIRESDIWIAKNPCAINDIETQLKLCEDDEEYRNYITELIEHGLLQNPELYILDYKAMKDNINKSLVNDLSFVEELIRVTLRPERVNRYMKEYNYDILSDEYMLDKIE